MKRRTKILIGLVTTCAASLVFAAACATWDTPYDTFEKDGSRVKILYDANGGQFAGKEKTNIADLYNVDSLQKGIKLLEPGSDKRGDAKNISVATRSGYFLAGWYKEVKTSSDGAEVVGYSDKWDFESDVLKQEDVSEVTAETPVLTLYAAWVPEFTYTFHAKDNNGDWKEEKVLSFSPTAREDLMSLDLPYWEDERIPDGEDKTKCSASMIYGNFPKIDGKTFQKAYFDKNMTAEATQISHKGTVVEENGTGENRNLDLYLDLVDGNWFHIYSPEQFVANARIDGSYEIYADIVFTDKLLWNTGLTTGEYRGTINGHGHTFSNITVKQYQSQRCGVFGSIAATAVFNDIKFKNVTYTLSSASRLTGSTYGLFAGQIASGAKFEKVEVDGVLHIGPEIVNLYNNYYVGLLCSNINALSDSLTGIMYDISCVMDPRGTGDNKVWPHKATIDDGMVVLERNDDTKTDPNPVN